MVRCTRYTRSYRIRERIEYEKKDPYEKRDTMIFASEEGMDTMIVDNKTLHDDHNVLFVPDEGTSVYNANGHIQNVVFHNKAHFECELMIVKKNEKVMKLYLLFKERALKFVDKRELQMTTIVVDGVEFIRFWSKSWQR